MVTFDDVVSAARCIAGVAHQTPVATSRLLNEACGNQMFLKCENLQRVGAFKFRGAYNAISRLTEADRARDQLQVRQSQIRLRQLQNQARLEVEDALIAMRRARASYEAAVQARLLQQESLEAEQSKFEVGASTSYFVIQYESMLAQAKSTEVAAKSSYVKARAALERAMGTILDAHHISIDAAYKGQN